MKNILFIVLLFFLNNSHSGFFDSKLSLYNCDSDLDSYSCNTNCKKQVSGQIQYQIEHKVNVNKNLVMWSLYYDSKKSGDGVYENCKVIDEKNWICHDDSSLHLFHYQMINGTYSTKSVTKNKDKKDDIFYSCGK